MPTNLYGPNDNFDLKSSHVLPAMLRKFHLAKVLENEDWNTLRADLDKLPIEGITGKATEQEILAVLEKEGIKMSSRAESRDRTNNQQPTTSNQQP